MNTKKIFVSLITASLLFTACGGGGGGGETKTPTTGKPVFNSSINGSTYKAVAGQRKFVTLPIGKNLINPDGEFLYKFKIVDAGGAAAEIDPDNLGYLSYTAPATPGTKQSVIVSVSEKGVESDPITINFETVASSAAPVEKIKILKTGQSGDDTANTAVERIFTETADGKHNIVDPTGLTWADAGAFVKMTNYEYSSAKDWCETRGWRLPTAGELLNLIDYGQPYNNNDDTMLQINDAPNNYGFTTRHQYSWAEKVGGKNMFVHNVTGKNMTENVKEMTFRCVKGDKIESEHFIATDAVDDTYDLSTGLQWSKASVSQQTAAEATAYCSEHTNQNGHNDWRVPTINELRSLIEADGVSAGIMGESLSLISSTHVSDKNNVNFNYGLVLYWDRKKPTVELFAQNSTDANQNQKVSVSCVRNYSQADVTKLQ